MPAVLVLTVPLGPPLRRCYRAVPSCGLVPTKDFTDYKRRVRQLLAGTRPLVGDVLVSGMLFRPRALGDVSNYFKAIEDALNGVAWLDDGQVAGFDNFRRSDAEPENPRMELMLVGERQATVQEVVESALKRAKSAAQAAATRRLHRMEKKLGVTFKAATYR